MARMAPSMIYTVGVRENFMRSWAARTRSSSMAMSRRARRASREVRAPRPAPISSTVLWERSPKASAMRTAAEGSARKCWPNLGVLGVGRAADTFGTLTLFLSDDYTGISRECTAQERSAASAPSYDNLQQDNLRRSLGHNLEDGFHAYCFCCLGVRAFFEDRWIGRRGGRFAARPGRRRASGQRIYSPLSPDQASGCADGCPQHYCAF